MTVQTLLTFAGAFLFSAFLYRVRHREFCTFASLPWVTALWVTNAIAATGVRTAVLVATPGKAAVTGIATGLAALGPASLAVGFGPSPRTGTGKIHLQGNALGRRIDGVIEDKNSARNARKVPMRAKLLMYRFGERCMLHHPAFDEYLYYLVGKGAPAAQQRAVRKIANDPLPIEHRLCVLLATFAYRGDWEFYRDQLSAARAARRRQRK